MIAQLEVGKRKQNTVEEWPSPTPNHSASHPVDGEDLAPSSARDFTHFASGSFAVPAPVPPAKSPLPTSRTNARLIAALARDAREVMGAVWGNIHSRMWSNVHSGVIHAVQLISSGFPPTLPGVPRLTEGTREIKHNPNVGFKAPEISPEENAEPERRRIDESASLTQDELDENVLWGKPRAPANTSKAITLNAAPSTADEDVQVPKTIWLISTNPAEIENILRQLRYWNERLARFLEVPDRIFVITDRQTQLRIRRDRELMSSRVELRDPTRELLAAANDAERLRILTEQGRQLRQACQPFVPSAEGTPDLATPAKPRGSLTPDELNLPIKGWKSP